jgi:hypothetical protein
MVYCLQNGLPLDMDVYDLAEWCCLAELGSLSMDNNNASVEFPDFTRGHWNDVQGYKHAWAEPAAEAAAEKAAEAYTAAHKQATADNQLWALYDAVKEAKKAGNAKEIKKAETKYAKAVTKAKAQIAKTLNPKKK